MNCHREEIHSAKKHKIDRFINYILSYILRIFTCRDLSHLAASLHPRQVNIAAKIPKLIGIVRMRQNKAGPIEGIAEN